MKLEALAQEMVTASRFGIKVERHERKKAKGAEPEPYGPYQIRLCDGASVSFDEDECFDSVKKSEARLKKVIDKRRTDLLNDIKDILRVPSLLFAKDYIERVQELSKWYDALEDPILITQVAGNNHDPRILVGLNPAWCYYVDEHSKEIELRETERRIRECMSPLREYVMNRIKIRMLGRLGEMDL